MQGSVREVARVCAAEGIDADGYGRDARAGRGDDDRVPRVFDSLQRTLAQLFPVLRDVGITHRWGGPLGIARDWQACVGLDRATGLAWAGGYVGDGVSTANLITGRDTELTMLPWVGHRSRAWEPEPLRWLGANAALRP